MLEQRTIQHPDRIALIYEPDEKVTYAELWELSGRVYAWLKYKGIGVEDIVMFCLPRGICLYACMLGAMRAGAAFVLTESENDCKRTAFIRKDCKCRLYVDGTDWESIRRTEPLTGYEEIRFHSLCYIAYTSGTTSHPKGVLHEYGSLENAWKSVRLEWMPLLSEEDTFLLMTPMNFVSLPIVFAFSCAFGNRLALMPYRYRESKEAFDDYNERAGINSGYVTPSFLRGHLPFLCHWRMCIISSEPADGLFFPNIKCYNAYASTESGCLLTVFELRQAVSPAPVGKSWSDIDVFVLDSEGVKKYGGTIGEICYRNNPYVRGYCNLPEQTLKLMRGGIFHTGDAGEFDGNGNLIIHGRINDVFKIGGNRIDPEEIAAALREVSDIRNFIVRGFVYKDVSSIIVFFTDELKINEETIRERLLAKLPEYMIPTWYIHLKTFPLLENGKLDKRSLLPPEGSWDVYRKTADSNLHEIGKGRTSRVYDMGGEKILKLYRASIPFKTIRQEILLTRAAHQRGIPVPMAYELVRSGMQYGIIMDRIAGKEMEALIREQPGIWRELIPDFAKAVKELHGTEIRDGSLPDIKASSISTAGELYPSFCTKEETEKLQSVFASIPDSHMFVHGDCHPGNAMLYDDKIRFIDMTICGKGHPVFDFICMYSHYVFLPSFASDAMCLSKLGLDKEEAGRLYDLFLREYSGLPEERDISAVKEWIKGIHAARICLAPVLLPGAFPKEALCIAKERAMSFADRIKVGKYDEGFYRKMQG